MKYYVAEETYNAKTGELLTHERVTGDTEDISWARKQLEFLFNKKVHEKRKVIDFKSIVASETESSFLLKGRNVRYAVRIVTPKRNSLTTAEILLAFNNHYAGDWSKVCEAIAKHEDVREDWLSSSKSSFITILDADYPILLKESTHPPFVVYYKGDIKLLSSESFARMAVYCKRDPEEKLLLAFKRDVQELPQKVIIVTSDARIAEYALTGPNQHKVIFVKPCGMNKYLPSVVTAKTEKHVIDKSGLVCTCFPDEAEAQMYTCLRKNEIMAGIADALLVVDLSQHSSGAVLASYFAGTNQNVMIYPTFPEHPKSYNNCLIKEGAYLVENAEDIKTFLKIKEE